MGNGMSFKAGRDMPPGMQEKMALQIAAGMTKDDEQKKRFICAGCNEPTNNSEQIGDITVHFCDECNARVHREVVWERQGETYREDTVICPYCGVEMDGYEKYRFDPGETTEYECECCRQKFDVEVVEIRYYSTKRSACEMPEDWQPPEEET